MQERLYILMRSDLASLNSGKAMAQASHASNAFVKKAFDFGEDISKWQTQTIQGFGTVLVLDGKNAKTIDYIVSLFDEKGYIADLVLDPTYPLRDGDFCHFIPVVTCGYVYVTPENEEFAKFILKDYDLHP